MHWRLRMNVSLTKRNHRASEIVRSLKRFDRWKIDFHRTHAIPRTKISQLTNSTIIPEVTRTVQSTVDDFPRYVLACGQNICGQLGLPSRIIERKKPQIVKIADETLNTDQQICSIYAGSMHSCALTSDGQVYTWGCNDDGALGRFTETIDQEHQPSLSVYPEEIRSLCAGDSFTLALASSGRCYITGCFRSNSDILGLLEPRQVAFQPIIIPLKQKVTTIACGADFCLLIDENHQLYSFGNNQTGQLARDPPDLFDELISDQLVSIWLKPSPIVAFQGEKVRNVWAGGHGFFAAIENMSIDIFACGANNYGQLACPPTQAIYLPVKIESLSSLHSVRLIACGIHHTLILDDQARVYGFGRSDDGRLGNLTEDVWLPQQIEHLSDIVDIAVGSSVSFAIDQQGQIYSFGMGLTCQTGHGNHDVFQPTMIDAKQLKHRHIEQISVGAQHTLFLVKTSLDP